MSRTIIRDGLVREIAAALNRRSRENKSNTPDFILAEAMVQHLEALERAILARDSWYDIAPRPGWTKP